MTRLFLECVIRAALIVAGTAIVLYVLRVKVARIKHRVWTGVVLLMLFLPVWIVWGPKTPVRVLPPSMERTVNEVMAPTGLLSPAIGRPGAARVEIPEPTPRPPAKGQEVLLGIYLLGLFSLLARLVIGTVKAQRLLQQAVLRDDTYTSASCAAPVTLGWLHPTVILPEGWRQWPQAQLDTVLMHEHEHARRRDPLVQWLALLNRAVFWFHPASWWLEHKLSSLAEEVCDSAVLARGYDARDYAETLIDMARAVMRSGGRVNVVGMAMPGSRLPQRIQQILKGVPAPRLSRTRMAFLAATCSITCVAFAAGTLERPRQGATAGNQPKFEVASVKRNNSGDRRVGGNGLQLGGHYTRINVTLDTLIENAYQLGSHRLVVGPEWNRLLAEHFDIDAKAEGNPAQDKGHLLLQSLLADRFKLMVHHETRQLPVYALELSKAGKLGPQIKPHSDDVKCIDLNVGTPPPAPPRPGEPLPVFCGGLNMSGAGSTLRHSGNKVTMDMLATYLSTFADRQVLDRTGLSGTFDLTFEFGYAFQSGLDPLANSAAVANDPSGPPSIFTALQEQLGLKLVPTTGPVDVVVIDHVEEPSKN